MRLFSQQQGTNYYKMTFGIISGELFIIEKIAGDICNMSECTQKIPLKDSRWAMKMRPAVS